MALSDDLRERVAEAVVEGGMSRNAAAKRWDQRRQRRALGGALQSQG
jgi:transposase